MRDTTGALEGDSVVKTVAMETQDWRNVGKLFFFNTVLHFLLSSSSFQSQKLPPRRQRDVSDKDVFAFLSPFFTLTPSDLTAL